MVKPYSPHTPSAKQRAFLELDAEEALYGGAAGGGKSDALIEAALQYVDVPGYSAALFRRTKEDLNKPGAILDRARGWFAGTAAHWEDTTHGFRFPSYSSLPGAIIHFGYGQAKKDIEVRYQGAEFQYIGIDELGQWQLDSYRYLFSRLRRLTEMGVPLRMRGSANPGGVGGPWVKERFIDSGRHIGIGISVKEYVALRRAGQALPFPPYFESPPSAEAVAVARILNRKPQGAFFVPAYAEDNPGLDKPEYLLQLARLDPTTRAQLENGDWWVVAGGKFFKPEWFQYVDVAPPGLVQRRYWDLAGTKKAEGKDPDWSAGVKGGVERLPTGGQRLVLVHAVRDQEDPGGVEALVLATAETDGKEVSIVIEEEPGSAGKNNTHNYATKVLFGWDVEGHRKTGPKSEYWKPLSAAARNGALILVRGPWNAEFVQELCLLTDDDSHPHDDQADAAAGLLAKEMEDGGAASTLALVNAL